MVRSYPSLHPGSLAACPAFATARLAFLNEPVEELPTRPRAEESQARGQYIGHGRAHGSDLCLPSVGVVTRTSRGTTCRATPPDL